MSLLVDSPAFRERLRADVVSAAHCVYIQTLSFEGDDAGRELTDLLLESPCPDRRLLIDTYSLVTVSDKFLFSPLVLGDREVLLERHRMEEFVRRMRGGGIRVAFTNPMGPLLVRYPARNHKKLVVIDDRVVYIGGVNFSDHNFDWHDMMLRLEDEGVARALGFDFRQTWAGRNLSMTKIAEGVEIHVFPGTANESRFARIFDVIDRAERSIFIESAYVTFPFLDRLGAAGRRGVAVTLVAPGENNFRAMDEYLPWECHRFGIDLRLFPAMTHLKAMLVDDVVLIMGSSNYDILSYRLEQEIVALITDVDVIAAFREHVVEPDLAISRPAPRCSEGTRGLWRKLQLHGVDIFAQALRRVYSDKVGFP